MDIQPKQKLGIITVIPCKFALTNTLFDFEKCLNTQNNLIDMPLGS